jgi:hypothetical protein
VRTQASFLTPVTQLRVVQKEQTQLRKSVPKARDRKLQERLVPAAGRGIWSSSDSDFDAAWPRCLRGCDPDLIAAVEASLATVFLTSMDGLCAALSNVMNSGCVSAELCSDDPSYVAMLPIMEMCTGAPAFHLSSFHPPGCGAPTTQ